MGLRQFVIKRFLKLLQSKRAKHEIELFGPKSNFYWIVWNTLKGEKDKNLFSDYVDADWFVKIKDNSFLKTLHGKRLDKLFAFSLAMIIHFRLITALCIFGMLFVKTVILPLMLLAGIVFQVIIWLWVIWKVAIVESAIDFFKFLAFGDSNV